MIFNKKIFLILAVIIVVLAVAAFVIIGNPKITNIAKIQSSSPTPTPTVFPTTDERLKLLKLMPIIVKGEYIFEYLPESQFFNVRIEDSEKEAQIKKEIIDIVKPLTTDGDYCKFGIITWSEKSKLQKLPGC